MQWELSNFHSFLMADNLKLYVPEAKGPWARSGQNSRARTLKPGMAKAATNRAIPNSKNNFINIHYHNDAAHTLAKNMNSIISKISIQSSANQIQQNLAHRPLPIRGPVVLMSRDHSDPFNNIRK